MPKFDEVDRLLKEADAFIAGGQSEAMVKAAESTLGVSFPILFKRYLMKWGNLSFGGYEYYGLTRNDDFGNGAVPNCIWFTLRRRADIGLPQSLVVFRNNDGDEYVCIDTIQRLDGDESRVVIWDNVTREISATLACTFIEYLHDELVEHLHG